MPVFSASLHRRGCSRVQDGKAGGWKPGGGGQGMEDREWRTGDGEAMSYDGHNFYSGGIFDIVHIENICLFRRASFHSEYYRHRGCGKGEVDR